MTLELVVHSLPLVVVVIGVIDVTMDKWLPHVHVEEHGQDGEGDTDPVARETHVQDAVSLI